MIYIYYIIFEKDEKTEKCFNRLGSPLQYTKSYATHKKPEKA